ncbi:hypothetical protein [Acinetobacter sp. LoGeW2-3]|uniref:hypothetical protein n=1 Tax=Acinetobacter sp. LoGeW2-3 TaxID=1808001 RepID=UPI001D190AA2|nr:hypothetical protein [Acinetobacter sp. LoGeW2-3]
MLTFTILMAGIEPPAMANLFDSSSLRNLDDDLLALVSGQGGLFLTATDVDRIESSQTIAMLNQLGAEKITDGLSKLNSLFQLNEKGQLTLQINQDVVSIGVIECSLNIRGLSDLGNSLTEQIKFH